jgi:acetyl esterase/lipase
MRSIIHRAERWGYAEHARRRCTIGLSAAASGWHDRRMLRIADLRLRGTTGVMAVRVRWPGSAGGDSSAPLMVFLPDAKPGGGVDTADDALCHELCRRAGMVVLCAPWAIEREGAPAPALDRAALALDWCADHASELGADPERLTLAGRGAGAAAAFALAQRARESGWPQIERQLLIVSERPSGDCAEKLRAAGAEVLTEDELAREGLP